MRSWTTRPTRSEEDAGQVGQCNGIPDELWFPWSEASEPELDDEALEAIDSLADMVEC